MAEIVISEFMDEAAVADLRASFDVLYDKTLVDRPEELAAAAAGCRALIEQHGGGRICARRAAHARPRLLLRNIRCRRRGMAQGTYGGRRDIRQGARSCRIRRDRPGRGAARPCLWDAGHGL